MLKTLFEIINIEKRYRIFSWTCGVLIISKVLVENSFLEIFSEFLTKKTVRYPVEKNVENFSAVKCFRKNEFLLKRESFSTFCKAFYTDFCYVLFQKNQPNFWALARLVRLLNSFHSPYYCFYCINYYLFIFYLPKAKI